MLNHLHAKGYTDKNGNIKDTLKNALKTGTLDLPKKFEAARERFESIIRNADRRPPLRDASKDVTVKLKKQVTASPEFLELWNKIKQKTTYRVNIDSAVLISRCVKDLQEMDPIPSARLVTQNAIIHIESAGVSHQETGMRTTDIQDSYSNMPDVLAVIGEQTLTKRSTVCEILLQSGTLAGLAQQSATVHRARGGNYPQSSPSTGRGRHQLSQTGRAGILYSGNFRQRRALLPTWKRMPYLSSTASTIISFTTAALWSVPLLWPWTTILT